MKKYLIIFLTLLILTGPSLAFLTSVASAEEVAQEYTAYDGPSNPEEELENQGNYTENKEGEYEIEYIETREKLDPNLFKNIIQTPEEIIQNSYKIPQYLNYKSWQFWFLIFILILMLYILIRLFKKLSKINLEIKRNENYLREIKTNKKKQISDQDEILYSEPQDDELI